MSKKKVSTPQQVLLLASGILRDRKLRRKVIFQLLIFIFILFILGAFILKAWLASNFIVFSLFWGCIFFLTIFLILLAIFDMMRIYDEEKNLFNKEMADDLRKLAEEIQEKEDLQD